MDKNRLSLEKALKQLERKQTVQLLLVAVARAAPFYSKDFITRADKNGYLSLLFLSMENCRIRNSFIYSTQNRDTGFNIDFDPGLSTAIDINRSLYSAIERTFTLDSGFALDCNLARKLVFTLDLTIDFDRDFSIGIVGRSSDNNTVVERIHSIIQNLANILDKERLEKYYNLMMQDAVLLHENRNDELNNDTAWFGETWGEWLGNLRELGGSYWADWYERLFINRFKITDEEETKRHLSLPKELWDKELSVSAQWLIKMAQPDARHLNEARIILLGEKGAGKTSLARRLIDPNAPMTEKEESTKGVDVTNVKLSTMAKWIPIDRDANVHIWDFAGHAITHAAHRFFLSERCLYIIVYDGRTEGRNRMCYWLDHVCNYGGKSRVIVLVNLQDKNSPDIAETYFTERYESNQCTFVFFSIRDDKAGLENFRERLASIIAEEPAWDQKIPADYHDVKQQIEKIFTEEHRNHITRKEFEILAGSVNETEREGLLKSLTYLGICLWYPNIKGIDVLVLNPEWITRGIYEIINWLKNSGRADASIALKEFKLVLKLYENDYPKDKHSFLYQLMQNYGLAYKKAYREEIVIPQCLPEDRPAKAELPDFPQENSLYVEITASKDKNEGQRLMFPPDVLPRFIVRRSEDLKGCPVWRYGAVLKKGSVIALIEQEEYMIKLRVKNRERQDYLSELLYTLTTVLKDYPSFLSEKPEVSCCIFRSDGLNEMIPLIQVNNLVQHMERENTTSYYDPARNMEIELKKAKMYINSKVNHFFLNDDHAILVSKGVIIDEGDNGKLIYRKSRRA